VYILFVNLVSGIIGIIFKLWRQSPRVLEPDPVAFTLEYARKAIKQTHHRSRHYPGKRINPFREEEQAKSLPGRSTYYTFTFILRFDGGPFEINVLGYVTNERKDFASTIAHYRYSGQEVEHRVRNRRNVL
jgi:hypothetical protein